MDCPRTINVSILPHVVVANQALQENTKVRGPGVEAKLSKLRCRVQVKVQSALSTKVSRATSVFHTEGGGGGGGGGGGEGRGDVPSPKVRSPPKKILQIN